MRQHERGQQIQRVFVVVIILFFGWLYLSDVSDRKKREANRKETEKTESWSNSPSSNNNNNNSSNRSSGSGINGEWRVCSGCTGKSCTKCFGRGYYWGSK